MGKLNLGNVLGPQGIPGPKGDTGEQGIQGEKGEQGIKGDRGESFTVNATGALAERGAYDSEPEGFSFLDVVNGNLYFRVGATGWSASIPFGKGDKGDKGDQGDPATNLVTSVAGKAGVVTLTKTDVGLSNVDNTSDLGKPVSTATQTALNAKEDKSTKGQANGYASLDATGKIPENQLPALAITDTFVVATQAAMLALTAQVGDIAIRTDINKNFVLRVAGASTLANWSELLTPSVGVTSVAMSAPTGFSVTGSPVTSTGTFALTYASGYQGYTSAEASKLSGIAAGATLNSSNAILLSRANHTGTQAISTITNLQTTLDGKFASPTGTTAQYVRGDGSVAAFPAIPQGTVTSVGVSVPTGLSVSPATVTTSGTFALTHSAGYQGYTTAEANKLSGIAAGATNNSSDAYLLNRLNHTGTQAIATIASLDLILNGKVDLIGSTVTGGMRSNISTALTGTSIQPNIATKNMFTYANAAAFTLTAPSSNEAYTAMIEITNAASGAGDCTASGFTYADTSAFATTANARFIAQITSFGSGKKYLHIVKAS